MRQYEIETDSDRHLVVASSFGEAARIFFSRHGVQAAKAIKAIRLPSEYVAVQGDRFGTWTDIEYHGVTQRFRYIELGEWFWLADTACTQALWQAVMGENPSRFRRRGRPVEMVSWDDCQQFIAKLNQEKPGYGFRLPTEAQWEFACRAGTTTPFWFGETITPKQVNYNSHKGTVDVKSLPPNSWGLYEMHGNVWEWCAPPVLRGGSWINYARHCRSANRLGYHPGSRYDYIGFRLSFGSEG